MTPILVAVAGEQSADLAAELVDEEDIAGSVVCGPDPGRHVEAIEE